MNHTNYAKPQKLSLTPHQLKVVGLVEQAMTNAEIAKELGISIWTVKNEMYTIFNKTGVSNRVELAMHSARGRFRPQA